MVQYLASREALLCAFTYAVVCSYIFNLETMKNFCCLNSLANDRAVCISVLSLMLRNTIYSGTHAWSRGVRCRGGKISLDTVGQRMIPGGSNDEWLTDVGTASFVPTSVSRLSSLHSYHGYSTIAVTPLSHMVHGGSSDERLTNVDTRNCDICKVAQYLPQGSAVCIQESKNIIFCV